MKQRPSAPPGVLAPPSTEDFREDVIRGLSQSPKTLPCKYFYDEQGAALFREICSLPEYYITRTELQILRLKGAEMAAALGPNVELIGLGTGAGTKTLVLLSELDRPSVYLPIDISSEQLEKSCRRFRETFPNLQILPICGDYLGAFELPLPRRPSSRSVVYFPGSTIGNFEPPAAAEFLQRLSELTGEGGGLLIGVDLKKDARLLEAAYNDRDGVTAQFNLNLLARANRELDADFNLAAWRHQAIYNTAAGRIEMHLISAKKQVARIDEQEFEFERGEHIVTEYSYKYSPEEFAALAGAAGFEFINLWTDSDALFGVFYFAVAA